VFFGASAVAGQEEPPAPQDSTKGMTPDLETAAHAPLPTPNPALVKPMKLDYVVAVSFGGQQFIIGMTRTIEPEMRGDRPAWRITSEQRSVMGSATDTFEIDRETLLPIYYSVTQGPNRIFLRFDGANVNGHITMPEGEMPIALSFDGPFFGEAGAIEVTLPALALDEGCTAAVRIFEWLTQQSRPMRLTVAGKEQITVPAGTFETFKITLEPLDGASGGGTFFIAEKEPRCVVQATFPIPEQFGGGTLTERLAAYEMMTADQ
jgi:hypothetical protein